MDTLTRLLGTAAWILPLAIASMGWDFWWTAPESEPETKPRVGGRDTHELVPMNGK